MKKITLWSLTIFCFALSWQSNAQYGCDSAVTISDGYTATGITTLGDGSQDWNNNPANTCVFGGYFSSDVYMYEYTSTNNENISLTTFNRAANVAAGMYTTCSGINFSNCLAGAVLATGAPTTISAILEPGQTIYIAIGAFSGALDFDITDFTVTTITCPAPSNLGVTNITTSSATLSWTIGDAETAWEYALQVPETGVPSGSGTPAPTNPINIMDLTPETYYEFYVRADCGSDDYSDWVGPYNFSTKCESTTQFNEDLESTDGIALPVCLSQVGTTGVVKTVNNASVSDTGARALHLQSYSPTDRGMVALQTVSNADAGTHQMKMNYKATVASQVGQTLELGYLTDASDPDTFISISSVITTSTTPSEFVSIPSGMPAGEVTFALRAGEENKNLLVDDITWELAPTCPSPSNLSISSVTSASVSLNWLEIGSAFTWDIEWGTTGFTPTGTPTINGTIDNPYMLSGLNPSTTYQFYVRADCGGGDTSDWAGPFEFTTACATFSLPFTEDFTSFIPSCWNEGNNTEIAEGPNGSNGDWAQDGFLNNGFSGAARFNFFQSGDKDWLVSPTLDLSSGDNGIALMVGTTDFSGTTSVTMEADDEVLLLISEDNGATWNTLYTWNAANSPSNTGDQVIIDMSAYSSATSKLALWANEGDTGTIDYNFYVDDINVDTYSTLSVESFENYNPNAFTYFPNPVEGIITFKAQNNIQNITIYDMLGQQVLEVKPFTVNKVLNLSQLATGSYIIKVIVNDTPKVIKVLKQ